MKSKFYFTIYYLMIVLYALLYFGLENYMISITDTEEMMIYDGPTTLDLSILMLNVIIVIASTILFIMKKRIDNKKVTYLNIIFILFMLLVFIGILLMNSNMIVPFVQSNYYLQLMLIPFTTVNLYNLLNIQR